MKPGQPIRGDHLIKCGSVFPDAVDYFTKMTRLTNTKAFATRDRTHRPAPQWAFRIPSRHFSQYPESFSTGAPGPLSQSGTASDTSRGTRTLSRRSMMSLLNIGFAPAIL